jgi:hypothetical protein
MLFEDQVAAAAAAPAIERTLKISLPAGDDAEMIALLGDLLGWRRASAGTARLHLQGKANVVLVSSNDPGLDKVLERNGLDRLVRPLRLGALEQLMVVAG